MVKILWNDIDMALLFDRANVGGGGVILILMPLYFDEKNIENGGGERGSQLTFKRLAYLV